MNLKEKKEQIRIKKISKNVLQSPNKITLCKDNKYENIKIDISNNLISASNKNDIELLKRKIKEFLIIMYSKCENFDDTIFIKNVKKTFFDISKTKKEFDNIISEVSLYNGCNIFPLNSFAAINTPLLYLASVDHDVFSKYNLYPTFYGDLTFVTEWYTRLLFERYFEKDANDFNHPISLIILTQLENILGKDFIEKAYFQGKLREALSTLCYYLSESEFYCLFVEINNILHDEEEPQLTGYFSDKKETQKSLSLIGFMLFKYIKRKICAIEGIDNKIEFFNSLECATSITYSINEEKINFDFYNEKMLFACSKELELSYTKTKRN